MIFLTVGTQLPFDRLVRAVDSWAGSHGRFDVFAQIGPSQYRPEHIQWQEFVDADDFRRRVAKADIVVAHAGMGSIITALEFGKAIVVMPRRAELMEHRNDHQLATAKQFLAQGRILVAFDEQELPKKLEEARHRKSLGRISETASEELLECLRQFINAPGRDAMGARPNNSKPRVGALTGVSHADAKLEQL